MAWSIDTMETGFVLEGLSFKSTAKTKAILIGGGHRGGEVTYDQALDVDVNGYVEEGATPFAQELGTELTLANTMPTGLVPTVAASGLLILRDREEAPKIEDFVGLNLKGEYMPYYATA